MNPLGCTQSPLGTSGPQDKIQCDKLGILGPSKYLNLNLEKRVGLINMPKRAENYSDQRKEHVQRYGGMKLVYLKYQFCVRLHQGQKS